MKKTVVLLAVTLIAMVSIAQDQWKIDPAHSSLNFNIAHSGISIVNGKFIDYTGVLTINGEAFESAKVNFVIDVASINTNIEMRDNHLRGVDFFDVEKYPTMTFESSKVLATGKPDCYLLYGKLTIKDVTKDVIFDVHYGGEVKNDKGEKIGFEAKTTINRFDYNIDFDPTATGVGKDVSIIVYGQFVKQ